MKSISLIIAEFKIKINFKLNPNDGPLKKSAKKTFVRDLKNYFKDFIFVECNYNYDFIIDISSEYGEFIYRGDKKNITTILFKNISKRRILTSYQIGIHQFYYILLYLISFLLVRKKGFCVHSSAILKKSSVDLFLGKSGAGKSTISNLLRTAFKKLSDDISLIKKDKDGIFFYEGPEFGKHLVDRKTYKYCLGNIYFLKQSNCFKIEKIDKERSLKLFMENIRVLTDDMVKDVMDFVDKYDNFYFFYFKKDKKKLIQFYRSLT